MKGVQGDAVQCPESKDSSMLSEADYRERGTQQVVGGVGKHKGCVESTSYTKKTNQRAIESS